MRHLSAVLRKATSMTSSPQILPTAHAGLTALFSTAPSSDPATEEEAIKFSLTSRQKAVLKQVVAQSRLPSEAGDKEEASEFTLRGHVDKEGNLVVDNLSIEFMHRWMDCGDRPKPGNAAVSNGPKMLA